MVIYILLLIVLLFFFSKSTSGKYKIYYSCTAIFLFSIIVGLRWDVGEDFMSYYDLAIGNYAHIVELERIEIIPKSLLKLCINTSIPFYFWFIIMAFFQIFFIQKTLRKITVLILCWGIFFFITMKLHEQMNIVRQGAALCVILYAYTFIIEKKPVKYILFVILASMFHSSALICFPLYFLGQLRIHFPVLAQMAIFLGMNFLAAIIISFLIEKLVFFAVLIGYGQAFDVLKNNELLTEQGSGLGVIFNYFRYFVLILYSPVLIKKYSKYGFDVFYTLLFVYMCFYSACFYSIYLQRIFVYFAYADIIVFSFLHIFLVKRRHKLFQSVFLGILTLGQLVIYVIGSAHWSFIWDNNRFINFS